MEHFRILCVSEWMHSLSGTNTATRTGENFRDSKTQDTDLNHIHDFEMDATWELIVDQVTKFFAEHRASRLDSRLYVSNQLALAPHLCFAALDACGAIRGERYYFRILFLFL